MLTPILLLPLMRSEHWQDAFSKATFWRWHLRPTSIWRAAPGWSANTTEFGLGCHLRARESAGPAYTPYRRRGAGDSARFQTSLLMTPLFAFSSDKKSGRHY